MAEKKYNMVDAYKEAGKKMEKAKPGSTKPKTVALSSKKGYSKSMIECPECGAHFEQGYGEPD